MVERASDAIRARGAGVSLDELAVACGVSKPVLYDLFGDKVGLADAVAAELARRVTQRVGAALAQPGATVASAVAALVDEMVGLLETEHELYRFLVATIRGGDHGFFDSALVRVVRERGVDLLAALGAGGPEVAGDRLRVLIDGAFGFLFFAVESWQADPRVGRDELVATLGGVLTRVIETELGPAPT